jgi:hypothetical protein
MGCSTVTVLITYCDLYVYVSRVVMQWHIYQRARDIIIEQSIRYNNDE